MQAKLFTLTLLLLWGLVLPAQNKGPQSKAFDTANMDKSVDPCQDFFRYVNGNWLKENSIPADRSTWGAFVEISDGNEKVLREILEAAAADKTASKGSSRQKVGTYYRSALDSVRRDKEGAKPLNMFFKRIDGIKNGQDVVAAIAWLQTYGGNMGISMGIGPDRKNVTQNVVNVGPGGIGLPDRDYYLKDDAKSKEILAKYVLHVSNTFKLMGRSQADAHKIAAQVIAFETRMAKANMTRVERRNAEATYNKHSLASLRTLAPAVNWDGYFAGIGVQQLDVIIVSQPVFMQELSKMVTEESVEAWKNYLTWRVISRNAGRLSRDFVNENFSFYGTVLSGQQVIAPNWRRALQATDGALGEVLGQLYVDKAFPPAAKARMQELVANLRVAMKERIDALEWMSPATKEMAQKKLSTFAVKIGYPDKWRDYSKLEVVSDVYAENAIASDKFDFEFNREQLGKPVDKTRWGMTPPTVNAYYSPVYNEIVFPAGILQPPFFNMNADDAINYGGIGVVIGHEISHGFDDQGSKYDAEGNLKNWWTEEDRKAFDARTGALAKQYSDYTVLDTMHVNGKLTLGENIGDLGGVHIAYQAYKNSLKGKPEPAPIDGFTADQRFFLGFGQIWRSLMRPEAMRQRILTDPHSPGQWRVNGTLHNVPQFRKAFNCNTPASSPQVVIW